jgi:hypothetical protein
LELFKEQPEMVEFPRTASHGQGIEGASTIL